MTDAAPRGPEPSDPTPRPELSLLELLALVGLVGVMAVATCSLALAHLGRHDGALAAALGGVVTVLVAAPLAVGRRRPAVRVEAVELVLAAGVAAACVVMFFPGQPYAYGDKDPGVYVSHGFAIAREGDVVIPDEVLDRVERVQMLTPGARFPGFWVEASAPEAVTPQFYHLYPALLATAIDLVGPAGAWNVNPLLATLSVLVLVLAARRAAGTLAAGLTAALLVTSMMQVWQARYTTTEILAQLLLSGALLGLVLAIKTRWVGGGLVAGLAIGTGFLARPDGILYVLMAVVALGAVIALRRFDDRAAWFAVGLGMSMPYALWNAYHLRADYTTANTVPRLSVVAAATTAVLVGAVLARRFPWPTALSRTVQRRVGLVVVLLSAAVLLLAWERERLLGQDYTYFAQERIRSFNDQNLVWLGFFITVPGLLALVGGLAVLLLRRWDPASLMLVVPGLALLPLYLWDAKISPRLMWWVRRFVPGVLPAVLIVIALFLAWAICQRRWALRIAGGALAMWLVTTYALQSRPLRTHRELGGSYSVGEEVASSADGEPALILFAYPTTGIFDPGRNFPGPVWFIHDQSTSLLPPEPTMEDVERYAEAFADRRVLVVTPGTPLPGSLDPSRFDLVNTYQTAMPIWEESKTERPDQPTAVNVDVDVYELTS